MTSDTAFKSAALTLFRDLRREFPRLEMTINTETRGVTVDVAIPQQPGLDFPMELNLQNEDELGLGAGEVFWSSWFPSDDADVVRRYRDAISGIISGRYCIIEYYRWGSPVGADLQTATDAGWKGISHYRRGLFSFVRGASTRILQNGAPSNDALQLTRPAQAMGPRS